LGPGAYVPTNNSDNIERIGDIQLECNAELRFPIHNAFNGALFVDAGNIWNYHANELLPGGEFHFNSFYNQIALDAGVGLRLDFNIAILRLDWAFPLRNPYPNAIGQHWTFDDFSILNSHLVLNIGYPF
jgi:outer membrane protein assembly factor BamA